MGRKNSVKKFLVFPSGDEPALESLHEWGVDNLWRQRVPAVHESDSEGEHFRKTEPLSSSHSAAFNDLLLQIATPLVGALSVLTRSNLYSLSVHTECSCSAPMTI